MRIEEKPRWGFCDSVIRFGFLNILSMGYLGQNLIVAFWII